MKSIFKLMLFLMVLLGATHEIFAKGRVLTKRPSVHASRPDSKLDFARIGQELKSVGVTFTDDSDVYGPRHRGREAHYAVGQNFNITAAIGKDFHFGLSFKDNF